MSQAETRAYTTLSVPRGVADDVYAIKDEASDPNVGETVRRLVDHYRGAP